MNNNENDNPAQASKEDLLRFLDAPHVSSRTENSELASESLEIETSASDCPQAESYIHLAAGKLENGDIEELLTHAATCSACGNVLAASLSVMEGNPSPEETAAIAELAAVRMEWQQRLARELAATKARRRPVSQRPALWMTGAAIAAGLLLVAGLSLWQRRTNTPEHQLAMAYERSRTLELRIPEAGYAGLTSGGRTRGALTDNEPAPLLDARARLARELERSPQNAHWLQLQARADVLEERYDSATDVLDRLVAEGPVTAELLSDAASAYYQRGLVSGSELDRSTALDYLRRADELAPADPVILFNEAIVMEDRGQVMSAVEVWNRYITVERDPKWAAEGKRKLAALEQTLNRLKSHQSRIDQMLATPQSMDALAGDRQKLASLDEELSSYQLDKLLQVAYPVTISPAKGSVSKSLQQTRGSPCSESCLATRRLLKAIATSLEIQHHDYWLSDLLSVDIDSLPATTANTFAQALQLLGQAMREDTAGVPAEGEWKAQKARMLFQQLRTMERSGQFAKRWLHSGEERADVEYLFALQRHLDFHDCRKFAQDLHSRPVAERNNSQYPWINALELMTERVCDDTPETRKAGRALEMTALHLAEAGNYRLLRAQIQIKLAADAEDAEDEENAERLILATFHELYIEDTPAIRIANTIGTLSLIEQGSPRAQMAESSFRDAAEWFELAGSYTHAAECRMDLARIEMRIGAMKEAENQFQLAKAESDTAAKGKASGASFTESEIFLANTLLEGSDLMGAAHYLDEAAAHMALYSDTWGLRTYTAARGQLELARGHLNQAASILESEIRSSEGSNIRGGDQATVAEYAEQDHDLYAELAATWLAQGKAPENILALWERFRLRSRGLPITQCQGGTLDCEQPRLLAVRRGLENNLLIGQILLLDRVLVYRADKNTVTWSQKPLHRQDVIDAAQTLERAVSSPFTSLDTTEKLGANLTDALLPQLPASLSSNSSLLLESDPLLQNLSWPVLPTPAGPLGLQFPLAEAQSILAAPADRGNLHFVSVDARSKRTLVVGASMAVGNEPPLPDALKEARSVSRFLNSPELLLGQQATPANLANALGSATIFHFAGHAVQTGNGTKLLLAATSPNDESPWADGAFLRLHPPMACRLAVLSACSTGTREAAWNHPLQDIVETLGLLGVPEVVATRWQIDSEASVPFMDAFYGSLARGESVPMALTLARRVQSSQSLYRSPYYWGAYYVSGRETKRLKGELHASP